MADDKDNIVNLEHKARLTPVRSEYTGCRHSSILVIEHSRNLECETCKKTIDPFDFMLKHANGQQSIVWTMKSSKHEVERLKGEIDELKRVKRNLQAQVNNLKKKTG